MRSSKLTTSQIILLFTVLMLFSAFAGAINEDFSAYATSETVNGGACDLTTDHITIQNTGDVTSTYILDTTGPAAEWTNLAPQTFYLEQGEVKQVERFVKIPCSARGEYVLNTTIKTLFDTEKTLEQTLNVQNIPNVQIISKFSGAQTECPCTPAQYSFEVVNTGNHMETYELSVEPYSEAISMSTDFLILEPGQKEEVIIFINLACGEYGEKLFTLNALAQGTKILGQAEFLLDIQKCYDYELVVGQEYSVCQGVPNIIPFQINNNADIANEYIVQVSGPAAEWAYTENESMTAWGGQTVESNVLVFPPDEEQDYHTFTLTTISVRGEEIAEQEIILDSQKCYDYTLRQTETAFKAVECKQKDHVFVLENTGSREANYYVDLEGLEWLTTTTQPINLLGGEEVELIVSGETPCETAGEYLENMYVTIEEINQTYLEEKTFVVYPKTEAYLPEIELEDLDIDYEGGDTPVKITNQGYDAATYNLNLVASNWISLDTQSITLMPGENQTVWLMAYPTNDTLSDTYAGELVARVAGEDIEYAVDFYVTLDEDTGMPLWVWISIIGGGLLLLLVITILILVFTGKKKPETTDKKDAIKEDKKSKKDFITINKRQYRKEKKKDDESKIKLWPVLLFILIAAILTTGIYFAFINDLISFQENGNETTSDDGSVEDVQIDVVEDDLNITTRPEETETTDDVLTSADIQESLINIDRTGIPGNGNELIVTDETELVLPVYITNPTDRKAKFETVNEEGSWIEFERTAITVMPETTETTNIKITPDLDLLEDSDYSITLNTVLEGKKIQYEVNLDLVITKKKQFFQTYWPWLLGGLVGLSILLAIIALATRKGSDEKTKPVADKKRAKENKKPKKEKTKVTKKVGGQEKTGILTPILIGIGILIILAALGFWAYSTTIDQPAADDEEEESVVDETAENTPAEEPKLTEDDIEESLITIDRTGIPGRGAVLKLQDNDYQIPVSINNPTDRKAKFTLNISNESWIEFDQYVVLVGPQTIKTINMTLAPNMEDLTENNYVVTINTKLEGSKIDYEEELSFVLKEDKPSLSWWMYALIGFIIIGLVVLILEFSGRNKEGKPAASKKDSKKAAKNKSKKQKKPAKKEKEVSQINKEIADLRKNTLLKIKK